MYLLTMLRYAARRPSSFLSQLTTPSSRLLPHPTLYRFFSSDSDKPSEVSSAVSNTPSNTPSAHSNSLSADVENHSKLPNDVSNNLSSENHPAVPIGISSYLHPKQFVPFKKLKTGFVNLSLKYLPVFAFVQHRKNPNWFSTNRRSKFKEEFTVDNLFWSDSEVNDSKMDPKEENPLSKPKEENPLSTINYIIFRNDLLRWGLTLEFFDSFWVDGNLKVLEKLNFQHYFFQFQKYGIELMHDHIQCFLNIEIMFIKLRPYLSSLPLGSETPMAVFLKLIPFDCEVRLYYFCHNLYYVGEIVVPHTSNGEPCQNGCKVFKIHNRYKKEKWVEVDPEGYPTARVILPLMSTLQSNYKF